MSFQGDLRRAIKKNNPESVRQILQANSDFLKRSCTLDTLKLLLFAVKNCKVEIVELLVRFFECVEFKVDINLENDLYTAIGSGNVKLTELLLRNGARITDRRWNQDMLSVHVFCRTRLDTRREMLLLLAQYGLDVSFRDDKGQSILHQFIDYYVYEEDSDVVGIVEILLECGVPVDELDHDGLSPLHYAIYSENIELILYLVSRGAQVNKKESRYSPLLAAAQCCNEAIVDLLLKHGADINAKNKYGRTALHEACVHLNNEHTLSLLVRKGASVNSQTEDGKTPLGLLQPDKDNYYSFANVIIKEFSKRTFENLPVDSKDAELIRSDPKLRQHYENCVAELNKMSRLKFHNPYSFYSVFRMLRNVKKLSHLTKNQRFVRKFEKYLRRFKHYRGDLQRIFNEAVRERDRAIQIHVELNFLFGNILPDVVLRNLTRNLTIEDLRWI